IVQKDYGVSLKDGQDSKGQRWVLNVSFHRSKDKQQNQPDMLWEVKRDITAVHIYVVNMEPYIVFVIKLRILLFQMTIIVELALTSDGRTIVCYHPSVDIPYEHTKVCIRKSLVIFNLLLDYSPFFTVSEEKGIPIPRPDPVQNNEETHDLVLKTRLEEKGEYLEQGPMIEQLSKMFFTTKHRWYPRGHLPQLA
ncbi:hypothetical protein EI555_021305, partial [Monodon monoceros]